MKSTIILLAALVSTSALAQQDANQLKEASIQACDAQASAMPEANRDAALKLCKCAAENTDYELILKAATDPSIMEEVQAKALEVSQKCYAS